MPQITTLPIFALGASGNFSHLHVGVYISAADLAAGRLRRNLNFYPWLVTAYQAVAVRRPHAVAGPHQTVMTGDRVRFDGRNSLWVEGAAKSFRWQFHDGTSVAGPVAEKVYDQPGCYMAALWVTNGQSVGDVDFCRVRVFTRAAPEEVVPPLFVTYKPSASVGVNDPVHFRLWPQGSHVGSIQLDFGDGTLSREYLPYSALTHKFATPGLHIVTVTGRAGALPVTQMIKVVVER